MTDAALDMSVEALHAPTPQSPIDTWLARRMHSFGCSELGALALALGRPPLESDTKKLREDARLLFQRKARAKLPRLTPTIAKQRAANRAQERSADKLAALADREKRWTTKLRRAQTAIAKLKKSRRYYERQIQVAASRGGK